MLRKFPENFSADTFHLEWLHLFKDICPILSLEDRIDVTDHLFSENCSISGQNLDEYVNKKFVTDRNLHASHLLFQALKYPKGQAQPVNTKVGSAYYGQPFPSKKS